jgi:2'-5' RNA ligase
METARLFIAIDIGDEIRERLDELQRKLKKVHSNVRWTKPKNIHLTLAFLGHVPAEKIGLIKAAIDSACGEIKCFELEAAGLGTFGRPGQPRVVWAGIAACPALMSLQQKTVDALFAAEIDFDRKPFSPHLTLGRVKAIDHHTPSLLEKLEKYRALRLGCVMVCGVELVKSDLTPRGAEYTELHRSPIS